MKTNSELTLPLYNRAQTHSRNVLIILGCISTLLMGLNVAFETTWIKIAGGILGSAYILFLIAHLARSHPQAAELPDFSAFAGFDFTYQRMLTGIIILASGIFLLTGILLQNGWFIIFLSVPLAMGMLVRYRRSITRRMIGIGFLIGLVVALVETLLDSDLTMALLIIPLAISGALLLNYTRLTQWHVLTGNWRQAVQSFARGCLLAVPPALLNLTLSQGAEEVTFNLQFKKWWQAFYALQPGIVEEVWARLFLTTLLYALLRPTREANPRQALTAAMGIATLLHGLAHFPQSLSDPFSALFIALMYGIPLVLLYVKRDFEQAIAYHFFIDFIRFLSGALT